jgi:Family of unknown function (DUF5683)
MNRFSVALLLFYMVLPALSQESDTVHALQQKDTIYAIQTSDSIYRIGEENFLAPDTLLVEAREAKSPTRALMYALVLPGLGQAYNGKYWKMPIVWASLGVAGYAIVFNTGQYEEATINFILDESQDNERILNGWKRNMELSYIVTILIYGLQVLDAYVDANLSNWDVNDNLSMGISPSLQPMMTHTSLTGYSGGLTCSFKIRGR